MSKKTQPTFEETIEQIEAIVRDMEAGQLPLAESLAAFEKGIGLIKHGHALLKQGEERILELVGSDEAGQPRLEPFLNKGP